LGTGHTALFIEFWQRRGIEGSTIGLTGEQSQCLIRVDPDEDHATSAFFVASQIFETAETVYLETPLPTPPTGTCIFNQQQQYFLK
jgi:hypothetical protein